MGRDENLASFVLRWLLNVIINFTMGLIGALVTFTWYLWDLVKSFQPDPAQAVVYFFLAFIAAASLVTTYLLAMYGAFAGTAYVVVKAAKNADAVCLQEVAKGSTDWLRENLGEDFLIITPTECGAAWSTEAIGFEVAASDLEDASSLWMVVDDDGTGTGVLEECAEMNNGIMWGGPFCD